MLGLGARLLGVHLEKGARALARGIGDARERLLDELAAGRAALGKLGGKLRYRPHDDCSLAHNIRDARHARAAHCEPGLRRQLLPVPRRGRAACCAPPATPTCRASRAPPARAARCPAGGALCGRCLARPPAYDATVAALAYAFPADVLVHALKFRGELALAPLLGQVLAARLPRGARVDFILPVPLSAARLRERGYNQALEIARQPRGGHRLQARAAARRAQPRHAAADGPAAGRARAQRARRLPLHARRSTRAKVAVVDDVMTTGATLDELAATLKRAGAARVVNWVVARTPPPRRCLRSCSTSRRSRPTPATSSGSRPTPARACTWSSRSASPWTTGS